MILAAGFGTRLLPYTRFTPKPLFTIAGRPILDLVIRRLSAAGCRAIVVNTHHLHDRIDDFLNSQCYDIPVHSIFEPTILGTGGAVKNVAYFWDDQPFMVINSDIVTDIDLAGVYRFHLGHRHPVTMVLHDEPQFNMVSVSSEGLVMGFDAVTVIAAPGGYHQRLAFTGIQVLDPEVLDSIPENTFYNSIDTYRQIIADGAGVKAYETTGHSWNDIGTPASYRQAVCDAMSPLAFGQINTDSTASHTESEQLAGDGSDRQWYRLKNGATSIVMVDHGIRRNDSCAEVDAFVDIGRHLFSKGIPVPRIYEFDRFAGLVFMEDVGDIHLQDLVKQETAPGKIVSLYRPVIKQLVAMSASGIKGFDSSWTYQTATYNRELILEGECRYFSDAFLAGYLDRPSSYKDMENEFCLLAERALKFAVNGFMHRDFQSRNIMVKNGDIYFIDFQGGRKGPLQYDLASLLIDPYAELPEKIQSELLEYGIDRASREHPGCADRFRRGYHYCCLTRNLQILGAFGNLSRVKGKTQFEVYIPAAVKSLHQRLTLGDEKEFPRLAAVVEKALNQISGSASV